MTSRTEIKLKQMSSLTLLKKVKAMLHREENWCKFYLESPDGQRHCILGAMMTVVGVPGNIQQWDTITSFRTVEGHKPYKSAFQRLQQVLGGEHPAIFNNTHSHADLLKLLDDAIARESRK